MLGHLGTSISKTVFSPERKVIEGSNERMKDDKRMSKE